MGSDDGFLGVNGCILTYSPQIFRYSFDGQVIHDDFCITQIKAEPGTSVSKLWLQLYLAIHAKFVVLRGVAH